MPGKAVAVAATLLCSLFSRFGPEQGAAPLKHVSSLRLDQRAHCRPLDSARIYRFGVHAGVLYKFTMAQTRIWNELLILLRLRKRPACICLLCLCSGPFDRGHYPLVIAPKISQEDLDRIFARAFKRNDQES